MKNRTIKHSLILSLTAIFIISTIGPAILADDPSLNPATPWLAPTPDDLPYERVILPPRPTTEQPAIPLTVDPDIVEIIQNLNESLILQYEENLTGFGPRVTGTPECAAAATYLYTTFQDMGLQVRYHNWTESDYTASNIEATLTGTGEGPILIVCGHYDCVAAGPGADDDASGVCAALATANLLKDTPLNRTIRFVAFSGEEQGLIGSRYYAQDEAALNTSILAVLNADMISYAPNPEDGHQGKVYYDDASQWICDYTANISQLYNPYIGITIIPSGWTWGSDHNSFWDVGYQAVFYQEDKFNEYYHSANDTIAHMNLTYTANYCRLILATLISLASQPHPLLDITSITGGLGCTATITNIGDDPAYNPSLTIDISPGIFKLFSKGSSWTEPELPIDQSITHRLISFGIGKVTINVTATADGLGNLTRTVHAFELGPFLLNLA